MFSVAKTCIRNGFGGAVTAVLMMLGTTSAFAQGMQPLIYDIEDMEMSAVFSRCAGLFISTTRWVGTDRLGAELAQNYKDISLDFMTNAAISHPDFDGEADEDLLAQIDAQIREHLDLYLYRFKALVEASGLTIDEDGLWNADMETCSELFAGMNDG